MCMCVWSWKLIPLTIWDKCWETDNINKYHTVAYRYLANKKYIDTKDNLFIYFLYLIYLGIISVSNFYIMTMFTFGLKVTQIYDTKKTSRVERQHFTKQWQH